MEEEEIFELKIIIQVLKTSDSILIEHLEMFLWSFIIPYITLKCDSTH